MVKKYYIIQTLVKIVDSTYLDTITNKSLEDKLMWIDNLQVLEHLLNLAICDRIKFNHFRKTDRFNLGKKVKEKDLEELLVEVKEKVDSFLEVENIDNPNLHYYSPFKWPVSLYLGAYAAVGFATAVVIGTIDLVPWWNTLIMGGLNGACIRIIASRQKNTKMMINRNFYVQSNYGQELLKSNSIYLEKERLTRVTGALIHEYIHHVQSKIMGNKFNKSNIFVEGHARGVTRQICLEYAFETENLTYMEMPCIFDFNELSVVYISMCKKLRARLRPDLIVPDLYFYEPSRHAIGNTLMLIKEIRDGSDIYKKMIHGEYEF